MVDSDGVNEVKQFRTFCPWWMCDMFWHCWLCLIYLLYVCLRHQEFCPSTLWKEKPAPEIRARFQESICGAGFCKCVIDLTLAL